jgi:hypothetical protein
MQLDPSFVKNSTDLLNRLPAMIGDEARVAHRLSRALNKLDAFLSQAKAQFAAGDKHATFNKQTVEAIESEFND